MNNFLVFIVVWLFIGIAALLVEEFKANGERTKMWLSVATILILGLLSLLFLD